MLKKVLTLLVLTLLIQTAFAGEAKMGDTLLVYGSFAGSTKEVAQRIKSVLEKKGVNVDMAAAGAAADISKYKTVIIGSAIHGATPHPDVLAFVEKNRAALKQKRTAVFIVCITITSSKPAKKAAAEKYPELVATGFTPYSTAVFAGNAPDTGSRFANWMGELILGVKPGDYRDWGKIEAWAGGLTQ